MPLPHQQQKGGRLCARWGRNVLQIHNPLRRLTCLPCSERSERLHLSNHSFWDNVCLKPPESKPVVPGPGAPARCPPIPLPNVLRQRRVFTGSRGLISLTARSAAVHRRRHRPQAAVLRHPVGPCGWPGRPCKSPCDTERGYPGHLV